ncbi:hypothetical protein [Actinokineospora sp. UTMC 2448]|uniref:hypothetical protein n=1 Tax=Actinokineospora sp. UTMC 2448 TaxID=2268449 RepID=UPI002164BB66|nr:hypothetical protein [Actinokineospora sp. UTMC 2448]
MLAISLPVGLHVRPARPLVETATRLAVGLPVGRTEEVVLLAEGDGAEAAAALIGAA